MRLISWLFPALCALTACGHPIRSGEIIDAYRRAQCVPATISTRYQPPAPVWDHTLRLDNGIQIHLGGHGAVGGRITLHYADNNEEQVISAGDYVYPNDVRLDAVRERLYVRAEGLAAGVHHETWLYEHDLRARKLAARSLVDPTVLPGVCPPR